MQTFMSAEYVCTLHCTPRERISATSSSARRSCCCEPHCAAGRRQGQGTIRVRGVAAELKATRCWRDGQRRCACKFLAPFVAAMGSRPHVTAGQAGSP